MESTTSLIVIISILSGLLIYVFLLIDASIYVKIPYEFRSKFKNWIKYYIPGGGIYIAIMYYINKNKNYKDNK